MLIIQLLTFTVVNTGDHIHDTRPWNNYNDTGCTSVQKVHEYELCLHSCR